MFQKQEWRISVQLKDYATVTDFCRLFMENADGLYLLSLLLTADQERAVKCFLAALKECRQAKVFKEWAQSWSRRAIVKTGIRMLSPGPGDREAEAVSRISAAAALDDTLAAILRLSTFERFVYVMTILESHSVQETAMLLDCTKLEVVAARTKALQLAAGTGDEGWTPIVTAPDAVYAEGLLEQCLEPEQAA